MTIKRPRKTQFLVRASYREVADTPQRPRGRRVEGFSEREVVEHGREARRKRQPIWANPFYGGRAALWRKGWRRSVDREVC